MFRSSALVTLLALTASALGFLVQLMLARRYGISVDVDAYLFALSVPTFIAGMVSAMLSYELVPRLIAFETDDIYQRQYLTSVLIGVTGVAMLIGVAGGIATTLQSQVLPTDSSIRAYEDLRHLIMLSWAIGAFQIIQGCLTAILNARRRYLAGAILALLPYLGMILLFSLLDSTVGITALPLGLLAGTLAANLAGILLLRHRLLLPPLEHQSWKEMLRLACNSPYTAIAMTCFSSYALVDAYWAPQAGEGVLATLGYAQRLLIAFGNLAVAGPSAVLVPHMAELMRKNNIVEFRRFFLRTLLAISVIGLSIAVIISIYAKEIVRLLFAHGVFGADEVNSVASTLQYLAPGMVAMLLSVISLRALFCLDGTKNVAVLLGLGWTLAYFIASMLTYKYGALGLAAGYSATWLLYFSILAFLIFKLTVKMDENNVK